MQRLDTGATPTDIGLLQTKNKIHVVLGLLTHNKLLRPGLKNVDEEQLQALLKTPFRSPLPHVRAKGVPRKSKKRACDSEETPTKVIHKKTNVTVCVFLLLCLQ